MISLLAKVMPVRMPGRLEDPDRIGPQGSWLGNPVEQSKTKKRSADARSHRCAG